MTTLLLLIILLKLLDPDGVARSGHSVRDLASQLHDEDSLRDFGELDRCETAECTWVPLGFPRK